MLAGRNPCVRAAIVLIGLGTAVYPVLATRVKVPNRFAALPPTLDGMEFMSVATYEDHNRDLDLPSDGHHLRYLPARPPKHPWPTMAAIVTHFTDARRILTLHLTRLAADGAGKAPLPKHEQRSYLAGLPKKGGIHSLRHSFATHLLESGVEITVVQKLLGHSSRSSTVTYLHVRRERVSQQAAQFLVKERDIVGAAVDTLSLDAAQAQKFVAHLALLGGGKYGLELLANLATVPPSGAEPVHLLVDSTGLKLCGAGEWLVEKHGASRRRSWRKLHIGVDADTGRIVAAALTTNDRDDGSQVAPLLDQIDGPVASFTGDGAYTGRRLRRGRDPPSGCRGHRATTVERGAEPDGRYRAHAA